MFLCSAAEAHCAAQKLGSHAAPAPQRQGEITQKFAIATAAMRFRRRKPLNHKREPARLLN
jgi:hypothetical protein